MGYVFIIRPKKKGKVEVGPNNSIAFDDSRVEESDDLRLHETGKHSKEELKKRLVNTYKAIREVERGGQREVKEQGESRKEQGVLSQGQGVREEKGEKSVVDRNQGAVGSKQGVEIKEERAESMGQRAMNEERGETEEQGEKRKGQGRRSEGQGEWMTDKEIEF